MLRAAALVELQLAGLLADEDGRPAVRAGTPPSDPVLDGILRRIAGSRPRRWQHWINADARRMVPATRDGLAAARLIEVQPHRVLGIFPATRVRVPDPLLRERIVSTVEMAITGTHLVTDADAALVALAAAAEIGRLLPGKQRRAHRDRVAELTARTGPVPPALRRVLRSRRTAAASAG